VIEKFRLGELQILVATSVAEEGLDIQSCQFVIRFNPLQTLSGYVQSRGRARRLDAIYIVMIESNDCKYMNKFTKLKECEKMMMDQVQMSNVNKYVDIHNFEVQLNNMFKNQSIVYKSEIENNIERFDSSIEFPSSSPFFPLLKEQNIKEEIEEEMNTKSQNIEEPDKIYLVQGTGALVSMNSAINLIGRYCSYLPQDNYCQFKPLYDIKSENFTKLDGRLNRYRCTVKLPINSPVRIVHGKWMRSISDAKKYAAWIACTKLHKIGALDDQLIISNELNSHLLRRKEYDQINDESDEEIDVSFRDNFKINDKNYYKNMQDQVWSYSCNERNWKSLEISKTITMYFYPIHTKFNGSTTTRFAILSWHYLPHCFPLELANKMRDITQIQILSGKDSVPSSMTFSYSDLETLQKYFQVLFSAILPSTQYEFMLNTKMNELSPLLAVPLQQQKIDYADGTNLMDYEIDWNEIWRVVNFPYQYCASKATVTTSPSFVPLELKPHDTNQIDLHNMLNTTGYDFVQKLLSNHLLVHRQYLRKMTFKNIQNIADLKKLKVFQKDTYLGTYYEWLQCRWKPEMFSSESAQELVKTEKQIHLNIDNTVTLVITGKAPSINSLKELKVYKKHKIPMVEESVKSPLEFSQLCNTLNFYEERKTAKPSAMLDGMQSLYSIKSCDDSESLPNESFDAITVNSVSDVGQSIHFLDEFDIHPMYLETVVNAKYLPSFLWHLYQESVIALFQSTYLPAFLESQNLSLKYALASSSCGLPQDYERFETLGDSILKFSTSVFLVSRYPKYHEGNISPFCCFVLR
jgi:dsRNA-specific ribonuclease